MLSTSQQMRPKHASSCRTGQADACMDHLVTISMQSSNPDDEESYRASIHKLFNNIKVAIGRRHV